MKKYKRFEEYIIIKKDEIPPKRAKPKRDATRAYGSNSTPASQLQSAAVKMLETPMTPMSLSLSSSNSVVQPLLTNFIQNFGRVQNPPQPKLQVHGGALSPLTCPSSTLRGVFSKTFLVSSCLLSPPNTAKSAYCPRARRILVMSSVNMTRVKIQLWMRCRKRRKTLKVCSTHLLITHTLP